MEYSDEEIIEYLEGASNPTLEKAIATDKGLAKRKKELEEVLSLMDNAEMVEVPDHIAFGVQEAILQEQQKGSPFPWMQIAAAVTLLILGFSLGKWSGGGNSEELAFLRDEIQSLKQVTLTSTLQRHSASERIMAVSQIEEKSSVNEELLGTLITTLNSDESPNVRYAALQALRKFISNEAVRSELVKSLESQTDPLIQISLITILVEAEERSAIAPLKDIMDNEKITPEVKQQASVALKVLT